MMMEGMDPPDHFVETVVEEIGVDPGEEIVTSDGSVMHGIGMNTVVYSQGPDGIIMEGDEADIEEQRQNLSDKINQLQQQHMMMQLSGVSRGGRLMTNEELIVGNMMDEHSIIIPTSHLDHPSYVAMKPQSMVGEEVVIDDEGHHMGQVIVEDNVCDEMIVEQNVEVGDVDDDHGDIILVPNSMIKQEDIIEGGEVVVGSSVGNEIVIDHIGTHVGNGRFYVGNHADVGSVDHMIDPGFDDSRLVIDTSGHLNSDEMPVMVYDCEECGAIMKSRNSLKKHMKNHHQQVQAHHHGMKERSKQKKAAMLMNDMLGGSNAQATSSGTSQNRLYCCSSCSYTTQRRDKLDKHMQKHVMLEGFHPCGKKRHKPTIPPQRHRHNAEEYRCPMCTYSCTVYKALKKHMKLHTSSGKHFVVKISCKICGKDRSTEADLQKHMKKHREGKNFLCDVCGFASIQMKKIIQHRRMHTGEKPHLCPHCNYRSARRDNLRSHVRRMHKKENVYIDTFNPTEDNANISLAIE